MSDSSPTSACPDAITLRALLEGNLPDEQQVVTQAHVDHCSICETALRQMTAGGESWIGMAEQLKAEGHNDPKLTAAMERLKSDDDSAGDSEDAVDSQRTLDFLQPSEDPKVLGRLGQHEILEVIGWGGMGVVLKAFDPSLHRVVAVKVLSSHLAHHAVARKRFIREAQAAAAVCHDNVVTIHAIDEAKFVVPPLGGSSGTENMPPQGGATNELPKIVMQYVAGGSLQERIDQDGPLELKEILRIAMQTAAGLAAAHAQGVVHRDVKPANILLENGVQRVKLTDFGLARVMDDASLTLSGVIAGTPQYMAPEQAWGRDVDARADLFSLGAVIYAMCSGHSPFRARTTMAVLKRVCDDSPRPLRAINPDVPDWLVAIIEKLLAKNPDDRFQTATEVSELLGKWLAHVQQPMVVAAPEFVVPPLGGIAPPEGGTTNVSVRRRSPDPAAPADRRSPEFSRGADDKGDPRTTRRAWREEATATPFDDSERTTRPFSNAEKVFMALAIVGASVPLMGIAVFHFVEFPSLPTPGLRNFIFSFFALQFLTLAVTTAVNLRCKSLRVIPTIIQCVALCLTIYFLPIAIMGFLLLRKRMKSDRSVNLGMPETAALATPFNDSGRATLASATQAPAAALMLEKLQRRPGELRHRLDIFSRLVPVIILTVFIGGLLLWLFLPSPIEWTSSEALSIGLIGTAAIGAIIFLVAAFLLWFLGVDSSEVTQADQVPLEEGTTNETSPLALQLSPKIVVVAMVVTGVVLGFLSISVVETNSRNLPGFLGFSLIQLLTIFATTAAFREAWNTSRWVTWIAVLLLLPFVASLFGYLASNHDASGATQFFGGLQALTALAYEFTLLFVRPLFVRWPDEDVKSQPFRWQRVIALTCVLLVPVSMWVVWRMRMGESVARPNHEAATPIGVTFPVDPPATRDPREPQLDERGFPNPQLLSNSDPNIPPISLEPEPSDGLPPLTAELSPQRPATNRDLFKPLLGRWVVLTLQGDEPPIASAFGGSPGGMMGGAPGIAGSSASSVAVTPTDVDQLRLLEFRDGQLILNESKLERLIAEVRSDRDLLLRSQATSEIVWHGVFTIADDRLVICWTSLNHPLPRGFQAKPHEQLVVCRREWSRPSQSDGKGNDAVVKIDENSKLPKAEMPFSSREAAELQAAWAEKSNSPVEVTNTVGMKLRVIPPGTFGDPRDKSSLPITSGGGFGGSGTAPSVSYVSERGVNNSNERGNSGAINGPILVGAHEVTVAQFRQFVEDSKYVSEVERSENGQPAKPHPWQKPEIEQDSDQHPVVNVTIADAIAFCHWLSVKEQKPYRLLTRREWEFCARAGSWLPATLGPGKLAYRSQFFTTTAPVGSYTANPFGLHDFIGNVAEWAWHSDPPNHDSRRGAPNVGIWDSDPTVFCGGDFRQHINRSQPDEWLHPVATNTPPMTGFRVAVDLTPSSVVSLPKHWPTNQLLVSQELVRLRDLTVSEKKNDDKKSDTEKPNSSAVPLDGKLVQAVWLEMLVRAEQMPYAVEWLDFEIERRAIPAGETANNFVHDKIEEAGAQAGWKPIDLAPALRRLELTEFVSDPIPVPFLNSMLTMPIPKAVSGQWASPTERGGLLPDFVRLASTIQKPQLFRFLDLDVPHGSHHYRVRLKYRVCGIMPETVQTTSWFASQTEAEIDVDFPGKSKIPENIPVIELKSQPVSDTDATAPNHETQRSRFGKGKGPK